MPKPMIIATVVTVMSGAITAVAVTTADTTMKVVITAADGTTTVMDAGIIDTTMSTRAVYPSTSGCEKLRVEFGLRRKHDG